MQNNSGREDACGLTATVIEGVDIDEIASVSRLDARERNRCGRCRRATHHNYQARNLTHG